MSHSYWARRSRVVQVVHDHADRHAEEFVDLPHPIGVAPGQIVVHRDDMHALAGERVEIDRQRGDQRLAFAGLHFGDLALVQDHAADQLHVEMALAERAPAGLAHDRERFRQQIVQRFARWARRSRNSAVFAARASSDSACIAGSSAEIFGTRR